MAEAAAKIRLTMDGQQAIREADRVKGKMKEAATVGGELAKNWQRGGIELSRQLIGVTALVAGLKRAADAAAQLAREQGKGAGDRVAGERSLLAAGGRAGISRDQLRLMTQDIQEGSYSYDDAQSVINEARKAKIRDPEEIRRAARLRGSGLFQVDEIIDPKRRRVIRQSEVDKRFAMEGDAALKQRQDERDQLARDANRFDFTELDVTRGIEDRARSSGVAAAVSSLTPEFIERAEMRSKLRAQDFLRQHIRPIPVDTSAGRPIRGARGEGAY